MTGELDVYNNALRLIELVVSLEIHDVNGCLVKLVSVMETTWSVLLYPKTLTVKLKRVYAP